MRRTKLVIIALIAIILVSGCTSDKKPPQGEVNDTNNTGIGIAQPIAAATDIKNVSAQPVVQDTVSVQPAPAVQKIIPKILEPLGPYNLRITGETMREEYDSSSGPKKYEYGFTFTIENNGVSDVSFDTIAVFTKIDNYAMAVNTIVNNGSEKMWKIRPGESRKIGDSADDLTYQFLDLERYRNTKEIRLGIVLYKDGRYLGGVYESPLPLLKDLPSRYSGPRYPLTLQLVKFSTVTPEEEKKIFADLYVIFADLAAGGYPPVSDSAPEITPTPTPIPQPVKVPIVLTVQGTAVRLKKSETQHDYYIIVYVKNTGREKVVFDEVVVNMNAGRMNMNKQPKPPQGQSSWTLSPGQEINFSFITDGYTAQIQEERNRSKTKNLLFVVFFASNGNILNDEAFTAYVPDLFALPNIFHADERNLEFDAAAAEDITGKNIS